MKVLRINQYEMFRYTYINTSSVPENQEATLIFIKYMHDIVLKISFLDTNSQNWSNGSHLKLLQKSLKIQ